LLLSLAEPLLHDEQRVHALDPQRLADRAIRLQGRRGLLQEDERDRAAVAELAQVDRTSLPGHELEVRSAIPDQDTAEEADAGRALRRRLRRGRSSTRRSRGGPLLRERDRGPCGCDGDRGQRDGGSPATAHRRRRPRRNACGTLHELVLVEGAATPRVTTM